MFDNYLGLYFVGNNNSMTFIVSYCIFVALLVTFGNVTTRENINNMPSKSHDISLLQSNLY